MPTEAEVEAGARVMADLLTIDAPKLPFPCWMGSARAILEAAEKVRSTNPRGMPICSACGQPAIGKCFAGGTSIEHRTSTL